ncbi:olfactory receptor 6M1-like [Tiliqua scincoides]|uniref:olfactory receptor 6M1-like n=1 Tax=Tiliqua scincoides TaxID=71010 RepID=UPI003462495F
MGLRNSNSTKQVTAFILTGFQLPQPVEVFVFTVLLLVFLLTIAGNVTIITLVCLDQRLQTPMYFFLCNLSLMEIFFVLSITPKLLVNLISRNKSISFLGCAIQCYFYFFLGASEIIIIALMAFDRYVAICHPLRYSIIMNGRVCTCLISICWVSGCLSMLGPMFLLFHLPFCGSNIIDHFFCDYAPTVRLSCSDSIPFLLTLESVLSAVMLFSSMSVTALSYLYICTTVLHMHSTNGWQKTFSTCASHITVASIFYGSAIFMYSLPSQGRSQDVQKAMAVLTGVVTPLLNPFIYSLRNEKVKEAFRDCVKKQKFALRKD